MLDLGEDDWIQDLADIDFWSPAMPRGLGQVSLLPGFGNFSHVSCFVFQDVVDVLFKGLTSEETCEVDWMI